MVKKKILLAEDDADDQKLFNDFLRHRNDIVLMPFVENGEALFHFLDRHAGEEHPDLIILDQNMPKRNGLQTLQQLKEKPAYAHIPVVIYSTYADQRLVASALQMGATHIITKPVTREGYHQMMDDLLELIR
jgi:CheY-like chemotaxis protein